MWNVGVQRELGWNTMVDVSYVGTRGTNIFRSFNVNVPAARARAPSSSGGPTSRWRPTSRPSTSATATASPGTTRCRSSSTSASRTGCRRCVAYTYSKTEDNIATLGIHPTLEIRQRAPGASGSKMLDIPHIFSASATYELPFGKERRRALGQDAASTAGRSAPSRCTTAATRSTSASPPPSSTPAAATGRTSPATRWPTRRARCSSGSTRAASPIPRSSSSATTEYSDVRGPTVFNTDLSLSKRTAIGKTAARAARRRVQRVQPRALREPEREQRSARPPSAPSATRGSRRARCRSGCKFLF